MPKVIFEDIEDVNKGIRLYNGDIVIITVNGSQEPVICMVSSFGNENIDSLPGNSRKTQDYCSMVSLSSGTRLFQEPCSRKTTKKRIFSHLCCIGVKEFRIISKDDVIITINECKEGRR